MTVIAPSEAEIARAVRALADGMDWVARSGTLSTRRGENALHVYHFGTELYFMAKPLKWDDIFWSIMRMHFKRAPSATRHWFGANCPVPRLKAARRNMANAEKAARQTLALADKGAASLGRSPVWLPPQKDRPDDYVVAEVVRHIHSGAFGKARGLCDDVVAGRRRVTYGVNLAGWGSFFELAGQALEEGLFEGTTA